MVIQLIKINSKIYLKQYMHENSQENFENKHIYPIRFQTYYIKPQGRWNCMETQMYHWYRTENPERGPTYIWKFLWHFKYAQVIKWSQAKPIN